MVENDKGVGAIFCEGSNIFVMAVLFLNVIGSCLIYLQRRT